MNKHILAAGALAALLASPLVSAQPYGRYGTVVDVNPIRGGGARQVCQPTNDRYSYDRYDDRDYGYDPGYDRYSRQSGQTGGAVVGALIGGVLGNQIGSGSGRTAATVGGAVLGGLAGREIGGNTIPRDNGRYAYDRDRYGYGNNGYQSQRCWTEYDRSGRVMGYEVRYRADGRMYTTQLPYAPSIGSRIRVEGAGW